MITTISIIIASLLILIVTKFRQKMQNRLISEIDMTILEVSIPGCMSICFYMHPDKEQAVHCEIGKEYRIKELVPDFSDNISLYCNNGVYIMEQDTENCRIRITDKSFMPSGDPMVQGELIRNL